MNGRGPIHPTTPSLGDLLKPWINPFILGKLAYRFLNLNVSGILGQIPWS